MSFAPQVSNVPAASGAEGVCICIGHPLRLQVSPAPRLALVPHITDLPDVVYARSEAPGGPGSSSCCSGQGGASPPSPVLGFGGGSAAQGASENFKEIERKKISILICTLC